MHNRDLRRAVAFVGLANIAYFFVEFGVARHIGSVAIGRASCRERVFSSV